MLTVFAAVAQFELAIVQRWVYDRLWQFNSALRQGHKAVGLPRMPIDNDRAGSPLQGLGMTSTQGPLSGRLGAYAMHRPRFRGLQYWA